jgi:hypothetical protein
MIPFILYSLKELRLGLQVELSYEVAALWYAEYNTKSGIVYIYEELSFMY